MNISHPAMKRGLVESTRIFKDSSILSTDLHDYMPQRVYGRDKQLNLIFLAFRPVLDTFESDGKISAPVNLQLVGMAGTGKTVCISWVIEKEVKPLAEDKGLPLRIAIVNCREEKTEHGIYTAIGCAIEKEFKHRGFSAIDLWRGIQDALNKQRAILVVILDEADMLEPNLKDKLLYTLSRPGLKSGKLSFFLIGTNEEGVADGLSARTKSSVGNPKLIIFEPYSASVLRMILEDRVTAFCNGAVSEEVIERCARYAADEGDARKALDLLRLAGQAAVDEGCERVLVRHVESAVTMLEMDSWRRQCERLPLTFALIVYSVAAMRNFGVNPEKIRVKNIHALYTRISRELSVSDRIIITRRRMNDILHSRICPSGFLDKEEIGRWGGAFTFDVTIDPTQAYLASKQAIKDKLRKVISDSSIGSLIKEIVG